MSCPDCGKQFATVEQRDDHVKNVDCCEFYPPREGQAEWAAKYGVA